MARELNESLKYVNEFFIYSLPFVVKYCEVLNKGSAILSVATVGHSSEQTKEDSCLSCLRLYSQLAFILSRDCSNCLNKKFYIGT